MIAQCVMEKFVEKTYLYDFYGELLTEHQRRIYESVVFDDLSYAEAAEEENISRQGIHDIIRRCNQSLEEYESKLHLVERFMLARTRLNRIKELAEDENDHRTEIVQTADEILEVL